MKLIVENSRNLSGKIPISGCKNSILPIMAASLLTKKEVVLLNVPLISDVDVMIKIMSSLGSVIRRDGGVVIINNESINPGSIASADMSKIRGSSLILGPLLSRVKYAKLVFPGGCKIGKRPIDLHLDGVRKLGAKVEIEGDLITVKGNLKPASLRMDFPSVGATENLMMAAVFTPGYTKIENAAREPEIYDLGKFLNQIGAKIYGHGTDTIIIEGVKTVYGGVYTPIPDRIEAGTYMIAAAGCGGDVFFDNVNPRHLNPLTFKLRQMGIAVMPYYNGLRVKSKGNFCSSNIICMPHPGFPTDLQAPMCSLFSIAKGESLVTDKVFSSRFVHTRELNKMGANIKLSGNTARITGLDSLTGTNVEAADLRGGGALMLAGMFASGHTVISGVKYIKRGYSDYVEKLSNVGVKIKAV